jgi:hypothetical protein
MVLLRSFALTAALLASLPVFGQSGLRPSEHSQPGLDPAFARAWLAPEYDRFGFAAYQWRDAYSLAGGPRMQWSYAFSARGLLSMSLAAAQRDAGRESELDPRPLSVFGRYWFSPDWAVSAESLSRDPGGLLRLQDFRIGLQRRF